MKHLLCTLLLFPLAVFGQNWLPLSPGESYHYRLPNAAQITHTIRIDSSKSTPEGLAHYLNRVFVHFPDQNEFILVNRGQFLGQTMILRPNGSVIFREEGFLLSRETTVYPQAGLGQSWLAMPVGNVTASVVDVGEALVLGELDSVKTISFSNGTAWILSKNHGVVQAADYQSCNATATLSGLESKGLGDQMFRFSDFYDFNVGDVFEYVSGGSSLGVAFGARSKITVLEKNSLPNGEGFTYRVRRLTKSNNLLLTDTTWLTYKKSDLPWLEMYNRQVFMLPNNDEVYTYARHLNGGIVVGNPMPFPFNDDTTLCAVHCFPKDPNSWILPEDDILGCGIGDVGCYVYAYHREYLPKLGLVYREESYIDLYEYLKLLGAVSDGDTIWGSITPDWAFTSTQAPASEVHALQIAPNPANNWAKVDLPPMPQGGRLQIVNALGSTVRTVELPHSSNAQSFSLELEGLPNGMYTLAISTARGIWAGRLVLTP
jgi:hypothetical protein